jgi:thiosulfate reductase cytochrome b subunit
VQLDHLRFKRPSEKDAQSYNLFQRLAYLTVVFVLYPFMFITGFPTPRRKLT